MAGHNTDTRPSRNTVLKNGLTVTIHLCGVLFVFVLLSGGAVTVVTPVVTPVVGQLLTFDDVYPAILLRCTRCHGTRLQDAELDLRTRASMLRGGKSGPAMVLGAAEKSLIIQKLRAGEMPPPKRLVEASITEISDAEIDRIAQWIDDGAPPGNPQEVMAGRDDSLVSDDDRQFWAFQPPRETPVPSFSENESIGNPIDTFVLRKLRANNLSFSPPADRLTLIRRVTFDLTGLPPSPEEVRSFLSDPGPDSYGKLLDRLLASPRYGERQARFWLDLAGYEDVAQAFRYRDYVIRASNADKPYDRFLHEQIAGDELFNYENVSVVTPEMVDAVVATGFLRMTPDTTGNRLTNFVRNRERVIADEIEVFSSVVLGLTVQCARCHNHMFDPIPQRDYFQLVDVFRGAFDPYDWLLPRDTNEPNAPAVPTAERYLPYRTPGLDAAACAEEEKRRNAHNDKLDAKIKELQNSLDELAGPVRKRVLQRRISRLPAEVRERVRDALTTAEEKRTESQKQIAFEFRFVPLVFPGTLEDYDPGYKNLADPLERAIAILTADKIPEPKIRALWDRGDPSPTYLLRRGDPMSLGRRIGPGVPTVLTPGGGEFKVTVPFAGARKTGRRLALARWLTKSDHPLTGRVMVNRIWQQHFGRAIVASPSNFGHSGRLPTHPELLDWLTVRFMYEGWSIKAIRRLILTSRTYQQGSAVTPEHEQRDADNAYLSRMAMRRLTAEEVNDTLAFVSGRLDERRYGSPDPRRERANGLVTVYERDTGYRRSIYVRHTRVRNVTTLDLFDSPQLTPNCVQRTVSTVASQALHLLNDSAIRRLATAFAARVRQDVGNDPGDQIERVYWLALSRSPSSEERAIAGESVAKLKTANTLTQTAGVESGDVPLDALSTFCHVIFNSAALLYID